MLPPLAAVAKHAAANPEDPCVIFPDGKGDWRWKPWRWLETESIRWASVLASIADDARVGYRWRPAPEAVAADLGIQRAGRVAVPVVDEEESALPRLDGWLDVFGEDMPRGLADTAAISRPDAPDAEPQESSAPVPRAGGALVRTAGDWRAWSASEIATAAASFAAASALRERPVVLVAGDLAEPAERAWLVWALAAEAALVLPGDPAFAAWGLFWPRPTDACLAASELPTVRAALATLGSARAQRKRLSRLRRLLVYGGGVDPEEAAAWAEFGVVLTPVAAT